MDEAGRVTEAVALQVIGGEIPVSPSSSDRKHSRLCLRICSYADLIKARGGLGQARKRQFNPDGDINIAASGFLRVCFKKFL
jgi:hypothetical protein